MQQMALSPVLPTWDSVLVTPLPFFRYSWVSKWISLPQSAGSFKPLSFHCAVGWVSVSVIPYNSGWCIGGGSLQSLSPYLLPISMQFVVQKMFAQFFFRGDYSFFWHRFDVFMGGGEFQALLYHHLGPLFLYYAVTIISILYCNYI